MAQTALQVVRELNVDSLVYSLGIKADKFPHSLSDCFEMEKVEQKALTSKLSGFSRTLKGTIPEEIDNRFQTPDEFISYLFTHEKIFKSAAYKTSPATIKKGLPLAAAFLIIRDHKEAENYPELMEMRKAIEAVKQVHKATAKGSHKGGHTEEIQDAVAGMIAAKNVVILTRNQFLPFLEIASRLSLQGDKSATQALLSYHDIKEEVVNG